LCHERLGGEDKPQDIGVVLAVKLLDRDLYERLEGKDRRVVDEHID
jgi:hypothetical protein